jgi:TolB protein
MRLSEWSKRVIAIVLLMQYVHPEEIGVFQITDDQVDQWCPALYGDIIIWQEWTNGTFPSALNFGIFGYNLSTGETFQIVENVSNQQNPAIHGNIVVWQDDRSGNYDIYGYDLSTGEEFRITEDSSNQGYPAVFGTTIVWEDDRNDNCDIYGVDLSTGKEFQITRDMNRQSAPCIFENIVLWQDNRGGTWDIYGFDLSTGMEFTLICKEGDQLWPRMYKNIVVWTDHYNDRWDIYGYDFLTDEEFWISGGENALVYDDTVVWIGKDKNDQLDLYGCNLHIVRMVGKADSLLTQGKEAFEKKEYEEALEYFQKARELYSEAGSGKTDECDEWIQKAQEAKGGFCLGTGILIIMILTGLYIGRKSR